MTQAAKSVTGLRSKLGGAFTVLTGASASLLGGLGALATAGWGVKLAAEAETAQTSFTTLLGSAAKARTMMKELNQFSDTTPFESQEIIKSGRILLAMGEDAGNVMTKLKMLGDLASGSASQIDELAMAYGKIQSKGRAQAEQLDMFAERGVPIYATLRKQLGMTREEYTKFQKKGHVTPQMVTKALEEMTAKGGAFFKGTENQSKTLQGVWSNLVDGVKRFARELGTILVEVFDFKNLMRGATSLFDTLRDGLKWIAPFFVAWRQLVVAQFTAIGNGLKALADLAKPVLQPLVDAFHWAFGEGLTDAREAVIATIAAVEYVLTNFGKLWEVITGEVALWGVGMFNDLAHLFGTRIPLVFTEFATATMDFFSTLGQNIAGAMQEIWKAIESGGTADIEIVWQPITKGFKTDLENITKSADRELSATEKILTNDVKKKREEFEQGLGKFVNQRVQELKDRGKEAMEPLEGKAAVTDDENEEDEKKKKKKKKEKHGAMARGSLEAFHVMAQAGKVDPGVAELRKNNALQKKILAAAEKIAGNTDKKPAIKVVK
jgi:tape measure domain-containing protein